MKIGFVSMPLSGHLNPMTALARKLQSRGNEVVMIGVPDVEPFARAAGIEFVPFCEAEYPLGSTAVAWGEVAKRHGFDVVEYTTRHLNPGLISAGLKHLPGKLVETGVEAMIFDTVCFYMEFVPMSMNIPYVHIWNILHVDFSATTPPCFFSSPYETGGKAIAKNAEALQSVGGIWEPMVQAAMPYAERWALEVDWHVPGATMSKLAVVTQTPAEFDFPGIPWPAQFHYAGPFHDDQGREPISFPWERLTGAPLIYASLGTLVNGLDQVYIAILKAAEKLTDFQVVLSIGKNVSIENLGEIPSNVIVVRVAPQIELLKRAALCITHAGLNTALESLGQGVPMVAIPIGYDQPGVASRIAYHGVGEFLEIEDLTVENLLELSRRVMGNPSYREKAAYFQSVIAETHGLDVAASVIEQALRSNQTESSEDKQVLSMA
ncbi:Zeaxanthin glucosyl transferase [Acidisarcina polymorpha]|uniref:Zeaxanthin glucosyl transferase n=1 Tax=Acidisarcina polymorpha TaxID=2211140 RepID=A0A2Z5FX34_9BACT|nr:glycosyltransferase [Acidisarcina polymorpha]AXC11438.1 Zeaxanthin glucosyl transferase [Acidisarcina polymorpha]